MKRLLSLVLNTGFTIGCFNFFNVTKNVKEFKFWLLALIFWTIGYILTESFYRAFIKTRDKYKGDDK